MAPRPTSRGTLTISPAILNVCIETSVVTVFEVSAEEEERDVLQHEGEAEREEKNAHGLARPLAGEERRDEEMLDDEPEPEEERHRHQRRYIRMHAAQLPQPVDRKSTRLNSSH